MKKRAIHHPKTYALAAELGVSLPTALGHLELLWDFTEEHARAGDVGRWPDTAIARACEWPDDPEQFVSAMVSAGWLDRHEFHRLIAHDWPEHSQRWVKASLKKEGRWFLPCYGGLAHLADTEPSTEPSTEPTTEPSTDRLPQHPPKPSEVKPSEVKNNTVRTDRWDGRPEEGKHENADAQPIDWAAFDWDAAEPVASTCLSKLAQAGITPRKSRDVADIASAAALVTARLLPSWWMWDAIAATKEKRGAESRWAYLRGTLRKSAQRLGVDLHAATARASPPDSLLESLVQSTRRAAPTRIPAAHVAPLSPEETEEAQRMIQDLKTSLRKSPA